jgi:hypothetical protein
MPMPLSSHGNALSVFLQPDLFQLVNEKRIFFILDIRVHHLLLAALTDELLANGNSVCLFFLTHDTSMCDLIHNANACPFPYVTNHYTLL